MLFGAEWVFGRSRSLVNTCLRNSPCFGGDSSGPIGCPVNFNFNSE